MPKTDSPVLDEVKKVEQVDPPKYSDEETLWFSGLRSRLERSKRIYFFFCE